MQHIDIEAYERTLNDLIKKGKITKDTAVKYLSCINLISKETDGKLEIKMLNTFLLDKLNDNRQFAQYISAIRKYETYVLKQPKAILFGQPYLDLVNHFKEISHSKRKSGSGLTNDIVTRKINAMRNEKLKLAFRLQHKSGLRVKEISDLTKEDIFFNENGEISLNVKYGKGKKPRIVNVLRDEYLYKHLNEFTEKSKGGRLFYSRSYLKQKAAEYGFESHDLRRHNAKNRLKDEVGNGKSVKEAKKTVQKELGHEMIVTTNIYLEGDTD